MKSIETIAFKEGSLHLIDQRKLPGHYEIFVCSDYRDVEFAIRDMVVRGAPAIGATAAYGVYLAARDLSTLDGEAFLRELKKACDVLEASRPTAVNLRWAIRRMYTLADKESAKGSRSVIESLKKEANLIHAEDIETNHRMAEHGVELVPEGARILTHCNTGALATAGWGTALGVIREAYSRDKSIFVYADETRPRLQGARLTAWELVQEGIPAKLIPDNAAAFLMQQGKIDLVMVGADRIATNGDTSNKIGTYMLSICAKEHGIPFYIVAPVSTIDFEISSGSQIPIEERSAEEVTHIGGVQIAPETIDVYNPAFDVTPGAHISAIITDRGVLRPPYAEAMKVLQEELQ